MHLNWPRKQYKVFLETHSAICCSYCRVLPASCSISHNPRNHHRCCLSPRRGSVYIVCELAFDFLPLCVSLTLALTSSSALPLSRRPGGHEYSVIKTVSLPAVRRRSGQGAPQKAPPHPDTHSRSSRRRALGPVSGGHPQDPSGQSGDLRVHSAGPGSRRAGLPASPSVWGRKSRRALAGAAVPRAACPLPETVGTRFNWQNSTGQSVAALPKKDKLSQPFSSFGQTFAGVRSGVPRKRTFTQSQSNTGWQC